MLPKRFVYVIRSDATGRTYIGLTSDFEKRLAAHNAGQNASTAKYGPWSRVTVTEFQTEADAARFERYLKTGSGRAFVRTHFLAPSDSFRRAPGPNPTPPKLRAACRPEPNA